MYMYMYLLKDYTENEIGCTYMYMYMSYCKWNMICNVINEL